MMHMRIAAFVIYFLSCLIVLNLTALKKCLAEPAWQFKPSVSVSETFNSNIFSSSDETEDFITGIGAGVSSIYHGEKTEFTGNYLAAVNSYAHHPELNVVTHDGSMNLDIARWFSGYFRDLNINVREDFTYTPDLQDYYYNEERSGDPLLSNYGIRTGRNELFRNAASVEVKFPITERQNAALRYSNILTEYSDPALTDNVANSLAIGTTYQIQRGTVFSDLGIRSSRSDGIDWNNYFINAGLTHNFSPAIMGELSLGLDIIDHETTGQSSNVRGSIRFSRRAEFFSNHIGYTRELNYGSGVSTEPVVSQTIYLDVRGRHTKYLSSNLGISYAMNNSLNGNEVDIQSYTISAGAVYTIRTWLSGTMTMSHFNQESGTASAGDITRNLMMIQLVAAWDS